jgi:hypothetical protein
MFDDLICSPKKRVDSRDIFESNLNFFFREMRVYQPNMLDTTDEALTFFDNTLVSRKVEVTPLPTFMVGNKACSVDSYKYESYSAL